MARRRRAGGAASGQQGGARGNIASSSPPRTHSDNEGKEGRGVGTGKGMGVVKEGEEAPVKSIPIPPSAPMREQPSLVKKPRGSKAGLGKTAVDASGTSTSGSGGILSPLLPLVQRGEVWRKNNPDTVNIVLIISILWDATYVPFSVTWPQSRGLSLITVLALVMNLILLSSLLIDVLSTQGGYWRVKREGSGEEGAHGNEKESASVRWRLVIDTIAVFGMVAPRYTLVYHAASLARVLRSIYLQKCFQVWELKLSTVNPTKLRIFQMLLYLFLLLHWTACVYYWVSLSQGLGSSTWVPPIELENSTTDEQYFYCFYWSIMAMTGYADLNPTTREEKEFTLVVVVLGISATLGLVGNLSSLLANNDLAAANFRDKMAMLQSYMKTHHLPLDLQNRISRYYQYKWRVRHGLDVNEILDDMPLHLRVDVSMFLNGDILRKVPLFEDCEEAFLSAIVSKLRPALAAEGDIIIRKNEATREMYFLCDGQVNIIDPNDNNQSKVIAVLEKGAYFGEISCFFGERRSATVTARTSVELYVLDKRDLDDVLEDFPEYVDKILQAAFERTSKAAKTNPLLAKVLEGAKGRMRTRSKEAASNQKTWIGGKPVPTPAAKSGGNALFNPAIAGLAPPRHGRNISSIKVSKKLEKKLSPLVGVASSHVQIQANKSKFNDALAELKNAISAHAEESDHSTSRESRAYVLTEDTAQAIYSRVAGRGYPGGHQRHLSMAPSSFSAAPPGNRRRGHSRHASFAVNATPSSLAPLHHQGPVTRSESGLAHRQRQSDHDAPRPTTTTTSAAAAAATTEVHPSTLLGARGSSPSPSPSPSGPKTHARVAFVTPTQSLPTMDSLGVSDIDSDAGGRDMVREAGRARGNSIALGSGGAAPEPMLPSSRLAPHSTNVPTDDDEAVLTTIEKSDSEADDTSTASGPQGVHGTTGGPGIAGGVRGKRRGGNNKGNQQSPLSASSPTTTLNNDAMQTRLREAEERAQAAEEKLKQVAEETDAQVRKEIQEATEARAQRDREEAARQTKAAESRAQEAEARLQQLQEELQAAKEQTKQATADAMAAATKATMAEKRAQEEEARRKIEEAERLEAEAELKKKDDAEQQRKLRMQERKKKEEAERKQKEAAERKAKAEADRKTKEEAERKAKEDTARKKEAAARQAREVARKAKEEAARKKEEADLKAKEEAERKAKEEAERKAKEEAERQAKEDAERQAKEDADRKAKEDAERQAKEEAERQAKEDADRQAKEEADRKAKEEADRQAKEEADRQAKEEAERQAKEEAERQAKEDADRQAKEEADRKAKEGAARKAKEEGDRMANEGAIARAEDGEEMNGNRDDSQDFEGEGERERRRQEAARRLAAIATAKAAAARQAGSPAAAAGMQDILSPRTNGASPNGDSGGLQLQQLRRLDSSGSMSTGKPKPKRRAPLEITSPTTSIATITNRPLDASNTIHGDIDHHEVSLPTSTGQVVEGPAVISTPSGTTQDSIASIDDDAQIINILRQRGQHRTAALLDQLSDSSPRVTPSTEMATHTASFQEREAKTGQLRARLARVRSSFSPRSSATGATGSSQSSVGDDGSDTIRSRARARIRQSKGPLLIRTSEKEEGM